METFVENWNIEGGLYVDNIPYEVWAYGQPNLLVG